MRVPWAPVWQDQKQFHFFGETQGRFWCVCFFHFLPSPTAFYFPCYLHIVRLAICTLIYSPFTPSFTSNLHLTSLFVPFFTCDSHVLLLWKELFLASLSMHFCTFTHLLCALSLDHYVQFHSITICAFPTRSISHLTGHSSPKYTHDLLYMYSVLNIIHQKTQGTWSSGRAL